MRKLTEHIVEGDSANHQLEIEVQDAPGQGGAHHLYAVYGFHSATNPVGEVDSSLKNETVLKIFFQNGPIKEVGVNGITQEALLAIVIDRLKSFQAGPFASEYNERSLHHCRLALNEVHARTRERIKRGVEGTHQK